MTKIFSHQDIEALDNHYRKNFINSLPGLKPVNLIGTTDKYKQTNLAIFASVNHIGANPPLMGFIMRPVSVKRHTWQNIKQTESFTINSVTQRMYKQAHQTAARYPREVSEFEATGLDSWYSESGRAPYVAESPVKVGLELEETLDIKANDTKLIIGRVIEVLVDEKLLTQDGTLNLSKADAVTVAGLDSYHSNRFLEKMPYAKPDR